MKLELKHTERTCLDGKAFARVIRLYGKILKYKVSIVFDKRIKDYGQYNFDSNKRIHIIRISPEKNKLIKQDSQTENVYKTIRVDSNGEKYQLIGTALHELKHALQKEQLGDAFWNKKYSCATEIKNISLKDFYSECEIEARTFEHSNILRRC